MYAVQVSDPMILLRLVVFDLYIFFSCSNNGGPTHGHGCAKSLTICQDQKLAKTIHEKVQMREKQALVPNQREGSLLLGREACGRSR